jgi:hypothetical protein
MVGVAAAEAAVARRAVEASESIKEAMAARAQAREVKD